MIVVALLTATLIQQPTTLKELAEEHMADSTSVPGAVSMGRVAHFELPADDPERAVDFYRNVFGWTITKWDGPMEYWVLATGPDHEAGIDGGLMRRTQENPAPVNVIYVTALDTVLAHITSAGGAIVVPKMAVQGVGWQAYFTDTENNLLGLFQVDSAAR